MDGPELTPEPPPETPQAPQPVPGRVAPLPASRRRIRLPRLSLNWGGFARRLAIVLVAVLIVVPLAGVLLFRFVAPTPGVLVVERLFEGKGFDRRWRPISRISPNLVYGVIAAEDARFCSHHGFDGEAIEKALAHDKSGRGRLRGGSTISQQTAKNVFLWPGRNLVRKGLEAWYTVLIETVWGKTRIMEVYLNVVEWAPGVYGAEAASQRWFHLPADQLSSAQADQLAAILPSPLKWKASAPGAYVRRRAGRIGANAAIVREGDLAACVRRR